jgi:hypothetical protein
MKEDGSGLLPVTVMENGPGQALNVYSLVISKVPVAGGVGVTVVLP